MSSTQKITVLRTVSYEMDFDTFRQMVSGETKEEAMKTWKQVIAKSDDGKGLFDARDWLDTLQVEDDVLISPGEVYDCVIEFMIDNLSDAEDEEGEDEYKYTKKALADKGMKVEELPDGNYQIVKS